jgi:HEAT repeat protein
MNSRQANKLMMDLLLSDDPNVLEKVQAHLLTKGTQLVPQLVEYLDTCSHDSRVAVIELLGRIGDPFAVGKLSTMLQIKPLRLDTINEFVMPVRKLFRK